MFNFSRSIYALCLPKYLIFHVLLSSFIGIVYFEEQRYKQLTNDPFTRKQTGRMNDVIENGPYNSCTACVLLEYERAYKILPVEQIRRFFYISNHFGLFCYNPPDDYRFFRSFPINLSIKSQGPAYNRCLLLLWVLFLE